MGCCEGKNDLKMNKQSELVTKKDINNINNNIFIKSQTSNSYGFQNENIMKENYDSLNDFSPIKDNSYNDIPITKEVLVPQLRVPNDIIQNKKQLQLKIFESKYLSEGKILIINPGGLIGSERNAQDGITYFGVNNVKYLLIYKLIFNIDGFFK